MKVSRPVQILALILVIAGVGGVASMQMLGKSSSDTGSPSASAASVAQIRARAHHTAVPPTAAAKPAATTPAKTKARRHASVTPPKAVVVPAKPKTPVSTVAANGLPIILVDALRQHRIVVISIFDPQSQTDAVSYAEARAGAAAAGAGFLGVSVLDDTVTGPLTSALPGGGLLPDPGVLVYRAPGVLVERVDGFADRDSVAQLAVSGRVAAPVTSAPASSGATTTTPAAAAPLPTPTAPTTTTP